MIEKCSYCKRTEICAGAYPEGCFLANDRIVEHNEKEPDDLAEPVFKSSPNGFKVWLRKLFFGK